MKSTELDILSKQNLLGTNEECIGIFIRENRQDTKIIFMMAFCLFYYTYKDKN